MKDKKISSIIQRILLSAVLIFLVFYTTLPAINLRDRSFIIFLMIFLM